MSKYWSSKKEIEMFEALTSLDNLRLQSKIDPSKGNKVTLSFILQHYKGYDFTEFLDLLARKKASSQPLKEYFEFKKEHPLIELLGSFIDCGFLDKDFNYRDKYFIKLGYELFPDDKLKGMGIKEGLIMRDGKLLPVWSKDTHRLGTLWLYVNGFRVEDMVRYTSAFFDDSPAFSSTSDYVIRDTNELAISLEQARAIYNIYRAKKGWRGNFMEAICSNIDLCLMPFADPNIRKQNAYILEDALGKYVFDSIEVLSKIKREQYLMKKQSGDDGDPNDQPGS